MNEAEVIRKKRRHRLERIAAAILVAIAVAATAGTFLWKERTARELRRDQSYVPKKAVVTPEILLLQEYVRIDTSTPEGAAAGARWLMAFLARNGVRAELIESAPGRLNVAARIRGAARGRGLLLFNHIDVVPPNGTWREPPFGGVIVADSLYGRGTLDMKGIAITQLAAFLEVFRSGTPPAHDLLFLATADEETGSEFGMRWLVEHRPDLFDGIEYALSEGGVTEIMREQMSYFGIETGGKQIVKLTLAAPDQQSMRRFRIALEPYMMSRVPLRILPVVREYFRSAAPSRIAFRESLEDVDRATREGQFWRLPLAYRELTQNTIWCTDAFLRDNRWEMDMHLRNLPDEDPDARIEWLRRQASAFGVTIAGVWAKEGPAPISPTDTPLFGILKREATRRYQTAVGPQLGYRSSSDSRFLRPLGITCYGISPFPVDYAQSLSIHSVNERVRLDHLADGVDFMKNIVTEWAATE